MGFVEALRWYVLGGHSMARVFEMAGIYKIGNGGMTAFSQAILGAYTGDRLFNTTVREISHIQGNKVAVTTSRGEQIKAKASSRLFHCKLPASLSERFTNHDKNCLKDITFNPPSLPSDKHLYSLSRIITVPSPLVHLEHGASESATTAAFLIKRTSAISLSSFSRISVPMQKSRRMPSMTGGMIPIPKGRGRAEVRIARRGTLRSCNGRMDGWYLRLRIWADGWRGFVDGAIERGQSAVKEVVSLLEGSFAKL